MKTNHNHLVYDVYAFHLYNIITSFSSTNIVHFLQKGAFSYKIHPQKGAFS